MNGPGQKNTKELTALPPQPQKQKESSLCLLHRNSQASTTTELTFYLVVFL
jgi:hypothetical protein